VDAFFYWIPTWKHFFANLVDRMYLSKTGDYRWVRAGAKSVIFGHE
jgi:hypothetical protein